LNGAVNGADLIDAGCFSGKKNLPSTGFARIRSANPVSVARFAGLILIYRL